MVVPKSSATLQYPGENTAGLNGNHLTITKYVSKQDLNFITIAIELHNLVTELVREAEAAQAVEAVLATSDAP